MGDAHTLPTALALLFDQPRVLLLHDRECRELCKANDHLGGFHDHLGGFGGSLLSHRCQDDIRLDGRSPTLATRQRRYGGEDENQEILVGFDCGATRP
jgi:hypothetical protein